MSQRACAWVQFTYALLSPTCTCCRVYAMVRVPPIGCTADRTRSHSCRPSRIDCDPPRLQHSYQVSGLGEPPGCSHFEPPLIFTFYKKNCPRSLIVENCTFGQFHVQCRQHQTELGNQSKAAFILCWCNNVGPTFFNRNSVYRSCCRVVEQYDRQSLFILQNVGLACWNKV